MPRRMDSEEDVVSRRRLRLSMSDQQIVAYNMSKGSTSLILPSSTSCRIQEVAWRGCQNCKTNPRHESSTPLDRPEYVDQAKQILLLLKSLGDCSRVRPSLLPRLKCSHLGSY